MLQTLVQCAPAGPVNNKSVSQFMGRKLHCKQIMKIDDLGRASKDYSASDTFNMPSVPQLL